MKNTQKKSRIFASTGIILASLGLAYIPIPGVNQTIVVVAGTEVQEALQELETEFEKSHPNIEVELKFQGSQDMVNKYIDNKNDFKPTVLIPANGEILKELSQRYQATNNSEAFYEQPKPIAKTILVGVAWSERGKVLFPDGNFDWGRLEKAMQARQWGKVGGVGDWGSFDFVTTDPTRSNSGQLTMNLWAQSKAGISNAGVNNLNSPAIDSLFALVKRSVYQPPRSTDILLQEFITRGPNEADVATVYESIALHRWQEAGKSQGKPYQIYYLNPTVETVSTGAIVKRDVGEGEAEAGRKFLDFLAQPKQQFVFVQYGFRPVNQSVDLKSVPNSPWSQNIPGAKVTLPVKPSPPPNTQTLGEIKRLWERAN
ncbi:MAG: substrate-binding domain-containing protein [Cyanobacteria bacterium P01_A01_bin.45]|mgnify:CR=1 FL=1